MEYQKTTNLFCNENTQPFKFRTKNWVEIYHQLHKSYNTNSWNRFKTTMLNSSLCYYNDAYICLRGTITMVGQVANAATIATDLETISK